MRYSAVLLIVLVISTVCIATEDTVKLVKNIKPAVVLIQTCGTAAPGCDSECRGEPMCSPSSYSATVKTSQGKEYQITDILAKDSEADMALMYIAEISRERYGSIFQTFNTYLAELTAAMGDIQFVFERQDVLRYDVHTVINSEQCGFPVFFIKDENGNWRVSNF